jgi:prepilin-type processing-associated H-X9-DG protein
MGIEQPGSCFYNILPFLEQQTLFEMGADGDPDTVTASQKTAARRVARTPISAFYCPSRRSAQPFANNSLWPINGNVLTIALNADLNTAGDNVVARTDYAANAGDRTPAGPFYGFQEGPDTLAAADSYVWNDDTVWTGLIMQRSRIRIKHITDGTSKTYLFGEKYLNPDNYETGIDLADNENVFSGFDNDQIRLTAIDVNSTPLPLHQDTPGVEDFYSFGSVHSGVCQFVFADGSVHGISHEIDAQTHRRLGNRADGQMLDGAWAP